MAPPAGNLKRVESAHWRPAPPSRAQISLRSLELEGNGPTDERATVLEASVANFNFIFEISNLDYPGIDVHVASNRYLGGL